MCHPYGLKWYWENDADWWDLLLIIGQPDNPAQLALDQEILGVMESTLQLDSLACQESALHGLGHWQNFYPERVTRIIDRFLQYRKGIRELLRTYALSARRGCVL